MHYSDRPGRRWTAFCDVHGVSLTHEDRAHETPAWLAHASCAAADEPTSA